MPSRRPVSRPILAAGLLLLSLSACGRRGALEPPPDPSAPQQQASPADDATVPSPVGTPRRSNARAPYVRPKQPFILDPIL